MDLRPSEEQQQLIDAYRALYAKESSPERVREAEPLGFDERLWAQLTELGSVAMAVGETQGGWGASMLDLALVAQEHGRALGSAPLIETQVAARLLARVGAAGVGTADVGSRAADALGAALEGERIVTVSLRPTRGGVAGLVPAGAIADDVVVRCGDDLVLVSIGDDRVVPENMGAMPLADVDVRDGNVVASGAEATAVLEGTLDDWLVLMANALVGISQRSLEIGVDYVSEREAFDQKIGGFQAVGHRMADCKVATDGAELLAHEAAWAAQDDRARYPQLAAMAYAFASQTAKDTSYWALHFHGGYGFMLEYDIQLYYRRARAWANILMDSSRAYRRLADLRYGSRGVN